MFAIIKTGGKQYKIEAGDVLSIEKIPAQPGQSVLFNQVLLIADDNDTQIGTPYLENAAVRALVLENFKDEKVIVFKKKRRKQFRRTRGHRQELTKLRVDLIVPDVSALSEEELKGPEAPPAPPEVKPAEKKPAAGAAKKPAKKEAKPKAKAEEAKPVKPKRAAKPAKEAPARKKGA